MGFKRNSLFLSIYPSSCRLVMCLFFIFNLGVCRWCAWWDELRRKLFSFHRELQVGWSRKEWVCIVCPLGRGSPESPWTTRLLRLTAVSRELQSTNRNIVSHNTTYPCWSMCIFIQFNLLIHDISEWRNINSWLDLRVYCVVYCTFLLSGSRDLITLEIPNSKLPFEQ